MAAKTSAASSSSADTTYSSLSRTIWELALDKTSTRTVAFEEQLSTIREILAEIYQDAEEWSLAARVLQGIPLDSGHRVISDEYRLKIYIQIVALFLEGGRKGEREKG